MALPKNGDGKTKTRTKEKKSSTTREGGKVTREKNKKVEVTKGTTTPKAATDTAKTTKGVEILISHKVPVDSTKGKVNPPNPYVRVPGKPGGGGTPTTKKSLPTGNLKRHTEHRREVGEGSYGATQFTELLGNRGIPFKLHHAPASKAKSIRNRVTTVQKALPKQAFGGPIVPKNKPSRTTAKGTTTSTKPSTPSRKVMKQVGASFRRRKSSGAEAVKIRRAK